MEKRKRKENSKSTNVTFYDGEIHDELKEIALRNDTDVSSIVSNILREFVLLFKSESSQKTLFDFDEKSPGMSFDIDNRELKCQLLAQTDEEFKEFNLRLDEILNITNNTNRLRNN